MPSLRTVRRLACLLGAVVTGTAAAAASQGTTAEIAATPVASAGGESVFRVDAERTLAVPVTGRIRLTGLEAPGLGAVELDLKRFAVASPDARVVIGANQRPAGSLGAGRGAFRGSVVGRPGSTALVVVTKTGVSGRFTVPGEGDSPSETFAIWNRDADDARMDRGSFTVFGIGRGAMGAGAGITTCGGVELVPGREPVAGVPAFAGPGGDPPLTPPAVYRVRVAVETDFEFFSLLGDTESTTDYVYEMYAGIHDLLLRDADIAVAVTFVRIWDQPDDLFNEGESPLGQFRAFWNEYMQSVERDVAQFVTGRRDLRAGGVAYLNGVCTPNGYSWAGYTIGRFADLNRPDVFNRDVTVTGHELAHNLGSRHTHDYEIDECDAGEPPAKRGTIMSYCGQSYTGGAANTDPRFHTRVRLAMRELLAEPGFECVGRDCNGNGVDDAEDISGGTSTDANDNGVPDECEDCNGNGVLDDEDLMSGFSEDQNGNGRPDECEADCNENMIPDDLEIAMELVEDLNGNGVPDGCEADEDGNGVSDYQDILADMSLDLDRDLLLDALEDCDGNGVTDLVELGGAGDVWLASLGDGVLRRFLSVTGTAVTETLIKNADHLHDVLITEDRRVIVGGGPLGVLEFDADGAFVRTLVPYESAGHATGLAMWDGGRLFVADREGGAVNEFELESGAFVRGIVPPGAEGLTLPFTVLVRSGTSLLVASDEGRVLEFDLNAEGVFLGEFVTLKDNGGLDGPRGMCWRPDGGLLVTSSRTEAVLEFDRQSGAFLRKFNFGGTDTRLTLDFPYGVRVGPDGDIYVSRSGKHRGHHGGGDDDHHHGGGLMGNQEGEADFDNWESSDLHLTDARIYQFDVESGWLVRAYLLGRDTAVFGASGFDFLPATPDAMALDCNGNLTPDACDIAAGRSADANGNGVPDECEPTTCVADWNGDKVVNAADVGAFLTSYFTDLVDGTVAADFNGDGVTNAADVGAFLTAYFASAGPC